MLLCRSDHSAEHTSCFRAGCLEVISWNCSERTSRSITGMTSRYAASAIAGRPRKPTKQEHRRLPLSNSLPPSRAATRSTGSRPRFGITRRISFSGWKRDDSSPTPAGITETAGGFGADEDRRNAQGPGHQGRRRETAVSRIGLECQQHTAAEPSVTCPARRLERSRRRRGRYGMGLRVVFQPV